MNDFSFQMYPQIHARISYLGFDLLHVIRKIPPNRVDFFYKMNGLACFRSVQSTLV
jgi:hypothetical protein